MHVYVFSDWLSFLFLLSIVVYFVIVFPTLWWIKLYINLSWRYCYLHSVRDWRNSCAADVVCSSIVQLVDDELRPLAPSASLFTLFFVVAVSWRWLLRLLLGQSQTDRVDGRRARKGGRSRAVRADGRTGYYGRMAAVKVAIDFPQWVIQQSVESLARQHEYPAPRRKADCC